jgi:tetratricopeptide (TPR) repeat protein
VAVGEGVEAWDVLDALTGLVNKSMVNAVAGSAGATRYQLLETMRQYARERLEESGDADRCRRAHATYYEGIVLEYAQVFTTDIDLPVAVGMVFLEVDNLRAAVTWALDSDAPGDVDVALRIVGALAGSGPTRTAAGLFTQADRLLARAESSSRELRADVLVAMAADALVLRGDPVTAGVLAQRALDDGPRFPSSLIIAYTTLAASAGVEGDFEHQLALLVEGQRAVAARFAATAHSRAYFELQIASTHARLGDMDGAHAHAADAVRLAREAQYPTRLLQALISQAELLRLDNPQAADLALTEALELLPPEGSKADVGRALVCRAQVRAALGDPQGAIALLSRLGRLWDRDVPALYLAMSTTRLATLLADLDEPMPAAVFIGAANSGWHAQVNTNLGPRLRAQFDEAALRVHTQLGQDTFALETARGAAMTDDQLLRYLHQTVDQLSDTLGN